MKLPFDDLTVRDRVRYINGDIPPIYYRGETMNDTKGALMSLGVNGSLLTILTSAIPVLEFLKIVPVGIAPHIAVIAGPIVGGLLSLYGRLSAGKKISGLF